MSTDARIVDRGYQHYTGTRLGPSHALWVMVRAAMRRGLGIRRSIRIKLLPWLLVVAAFAPVLFVLAFRILLPGLSRAPLPSYAGIYNSAFVLSVYMLFAGFIAPDLLCDDRRERVLSLYFAAPITRLHYVAAQFLGLVILLLVMTLGPMLLLFAGNALLADAALTYVQHHLDDLWHIVLSGGLLALYYGATAVAAAAFTDRRAYATGAFVALMLLSGAVAAILARIVHFAGDEWLQLLDLLYLPMRVVRPLFNAPIFPALNPWACAGVTLGLVVVSLGLLVWRYLRIHD